VIPLAELGDGQITVAPVDGDVTVNKSETLKIRKKYASGLLRQTATNVWLLTGDLELAP
jgi:hypothetical protein